MNLWYCIKVVTFFLKAGAPLTKLDYFCDILEENAYLLFDRRGTSDLVPFILSEEMERIKNEIDKRHMFPSPLMVPVGSERH